MKSRSLFTKHGVLLISEWNCSEGLLKNRFFIQFRKKEDSRKPFYVGDFGYLCFLENFGQEDGKRQGVDGFLAESVL